MGVQCSRYTMCDNCKVYSITACNVITRKLLPNNLEIIKQHVVIFEFMKQP